MSYVSFAPLDEAAQRYLSLRTGVDYTIFDYTLPAWLSVAVRDDDEFIMGVLVAEFQVPFEALITAAIDDPRFMSRRLLHAIFSTLFSRAARVTAQCRPDNEKSIRAIRHLGFQYEGFKRLGIEGKWDALMFGMLRHECRWIMPLKEPYRGQFPQAA